MLLDGTLCAFGGCGGASGGCFHCEAREEWRSGYGGELDTSAARAYVAARWYAVRCGREPGVYDSCSAAEAQVRGWRGADMKRFSSEAEAHAYLAAPAAAAAAAAAALEAALPARGRSHFPFYAVRVGRQPGIYRTNDEAQAQVSGAPGNEYRGCRSYDEAKRFIAGGRAVDGPSARSRSRSRSRERSSGEREAIRKYYGRY